MSARAELSDLLPGGVTFDPDVLEGFRRDQATWSPAGWPLALARPASTAEVQALARWSAQHRIALVPRGAGTGVAGGANASEGCVVVSFERMSKILELDGAAMLAVVQPGVRNAAVKQAARAAGLWKPSGPRGWTPMRPRS